MNTLETHHWRCPACGRAFPKRNQWHSCLSFTVEHHFRNRDRHLNRIFEQLLVKLRKIGPVRIDAVKSGINIASKYHFAMVSVRKNYVLLEFVSDKRIVDKRIETTQELGATKITHFVKLTAPSEIDSQLMRWLRRAYRMQL